MSSQSLVSVIVIFLNAEAYFQEAIDSVFAQSYPHWELLLVDDGSWDGSLELARACAEKFPHRVRYLEHPDHGHRGMSATRNLGLRHACGKFVALLDADDVWLPHKLEQQVTFLEAHPEAGMLYAPTQYWHSWQGAQASQADYIPELGVEPNAVFQPPTLLLRFLQQKAKPPGTCSVLLRQDVVERLGGFVESFQGMYEDQAFFAKVCLAVPVFVIGEYSARYRQHPTSACSIAAATGQQQPAEDLYLTWLTRYLAAFESKRGGEWETLRSLLWPYDHPTLFQLALAGQAFLGYARTVAARFAGAHWQSGAR